jgi:hypothetical protein
MQVVLAYRWLMYGFLANFCIRVSYRPRHDLGRLRMSAPAVHKIDPWSPLSIVSACKCHVSVNCKCMYVDERVVEKTTFYSDCTETLVDRYKVYNYVVKLRIHLKSCSEFMIIGKAAGIDVRTIARKGLWGRFIPPRFMDCGYCYLVFPELTNCNSKAAWSVQ